MVSTAARKAKGRALQKKVADLILKNFPQLQEDDVRSTAMGQTGEDVQLSPLARSLFPYSVEAKKHARFAIYGPFEQAKANCNGYTPLLVIEGNRKKPLAIVELDHFMDLVQKTSGQATI